MMSFVVPQELLLLLDEYWDKHPELQGVPVYQASGLARKALTVFQTYIEMMNEDIKAAVHVSGGGGCATTWPITCLL